ncbi:MAG TPA: tetratricopeptide repeat protein, partial [Xanthomonadales bacterium]|nr:tetratricopeptide repeat protein [Xanthomonadales bacterium]
VRDEATTRATTRRLNIATIIVAVIAVSLFALDQFAFRPVATPFPQTPKAEISIPAKEAKAIAVLPFVNVSSDEEQEYFSDGLTEELLNVLARGNNLRVIGRTSSFQFKDKNEDLREIGRKLNVSHLLEGSVRRAGDDVRITVQLIDSGSGTQLWSRTFDRTLEDIFAVQDEIANAVTNELQVELLGASQTLTAEHSAEAYDWYLKGLRAQHLLGPENTREAREHFERSIELDPGLAVSWEKLAGVYGAMTVAGELPTDEGVELAKDALSRALELDPTSAGAYARQGVFRIMFDLNWKGAEAAFERALEIDPNNADALSGASHLANAFGRYSDALEYNARSIEVDPLNIRGLHNKAFFHYVGRNPEAAEAALLEALDFAGGNYTYAHTVLSLILLEQGRIEEAIAAAEKEVGEPFRLAAQTIAYYAAGRLEDSDAALEELIEKYSDRLAVPIGGSYAYRGDVDNAMKWLNRAYAQGDPQLSVAGVHPVHDNIQSDPRFQQFLRKLDLLPEN